MMTKKKQKLIFWTKKKKLSHPLSSLCSYQWFSSILMSTVYLWFCFAACFCSGLFCMHVLVYLTVATVMTMPSLLHCQFCTFSSPNPFSCLQHFRFWIYVCQQNSLRPLVSCVLFFATVMLMWHLHLQSVFMLKHEKPCVYLLSSKFRHALTLALGFLSCVH